MGGISNARCFWNKKPSNDLPQLPERTPEEPRKPHMKLELPQIQEVKNCDLSWNELRKIKELQQAKLANQDRDKRRQFTKEIRTEIKRVLDSLSRKGRRNNLYYSMNNFQAYAEQTHEVVLFLLKKEYGELLKKDKNYQLLKRIFRNNNEIVSSPETAVSKKTIDRIAQEAIEEAQDFLAYHQVT